MAGTASHAISLQNITGKSTDEEFAALAVVQQAGGTLEQLQARYRSAHKPGLLVAAG